MKRRNFFKTLGIGTVAVIVYPDDVLSKNKTEITKSGNKVYHIRGGCISFESSIGGPAITRLEDWPDKLDVKHGEEQMFVFRLPRELGGGALDYGDGTTFEFSGIVKGETVHDGLYDYEILIVQQTTGK